MGFKGDVGELDKMAEEIGRKAKVIPPLAAAAADGIRAALAGTADAHVTPYLAPWAPYVRGGSGTIGHRATVVATSNGVKAKLDKIATYHHMGTSRMVARPIIPNESAGVPDGWREQIDKAATSLLEAK